VASHAGAEFFCLQLRQLDPEFRRPGARILVAGCGAGHEAALIQRELSAQIDAIDVVDERDHSFADWPDVRYQTASVCDVPFGDRSFDAIFYHHVIEHVDDPDRSLAELTRVLRQGGWMFVGTPNRHRLVSSVGAHRQTQWKPSLRNKLYDNWKDWTSRLRGRFRNEYGAHAGFSRNELRRMLAPHVQRQIWLTRDYLMYKYRDHRFSGVVGLLAREPWCEVIAPSIYVMSRRGA
jgi:ubiquinone/menaquinone biosynthesis C-methylase UbiE